VAARSKDPTGRDFEARYGEVIVDRGIATVPSLLFRWQEKLALTDGMLVLVMNILSFYRERGRWPSVSLAKVQKWRDTSRRSINEEVEALERLGYLTRPTQDARFHTYVYDLTGLIRRLNELGQVEQEVQRLETEKARLTAAA
jgi:hypothetical protein